MSFDINKGDSYRPFGIVMCAYFAIVLITIALIWGM